MALPAETTTGTCFLQSYIEYVLALQEASNKLAGSSLLIYGHVGIGKVLSWNLLFMNRNSELFSPWELSTTQHVNMFERHYE